jgi:preprotein translocase subunit SecD
MESIKIRFALVAVALIIALVLFLPSTPLTGKLPSWWRDGIPKISMGLDLQGGMYLLLKVDRDKAVTNHIERLSEGIKGRLKEENILYDFIEVQGGKIIVAFKEEDGDKINRITGAEFPSLNRERMGEGKNAYQLQGREAERLKEWAVSQALETLRNRIDEFGVREPIIQHQGTDEIVIQLPGLQDPKRAIKLIGETAVLNFKLVDEEHSVDEALAGKVPPGSEILYQKMTDLETGAVTKVPFLIKKDTLLTGDLLSDASVNIDQQQFNEPYVSITFNRVGARIFERITRENVQKRLAIILDDNVYSAPVIRERIAGGRAQITGNFTLNEATDLAIVLRAGALPAPVNIMQNVTVGPSLGRDSIEKGVKATIIGAILVLIFMVFYYRLAGVLADLAMTLNVIMLLGAMAFFEATLTLPGIAGIILIVGMGIDSNVLILERIKEELRAGRTVRSAIDAGYERAWWTIMDSNITTLITAAVLFQFGSGPIKGFAVTLSLGILINLFTALIGTKVVYDSILSSRSMERLSI